MKNPRIKKVSFWLCSRVVPETLCVTSMSAFHPPSKDESRAGGVVTRKDRPSGRSMTCLMMSTPTVTNATGHKNRGRFRQTDHHTRNRHQSRSTIAHTPPPLPPDMSSDCLASYNTKWPHDTKAKSSPNGFFAVTTARSLAVLPASEGVPSVLLDCSSSKKTHKKKEEKYLKTRRKQNDQKEYNKIPPTCVSGVPLVFSPVILLTTQPRIPHHCTYPSPPWSLLQLLEHQKSAWGDRKPPRIKNKNAYTRKSMLFAAAPTQ